MGDLCIKLFQENSIGTIIKHIPGHGLAKVDSHNFTPTVNSQLNISINMILNHLKRKMFFCYDSTCYLQKIRSVIIPQLIQKK